MTDGMLKSVRIDIEHPGHVTFRQDGPQNRVHPRLQVRSPNAVARFTRRRHDQLPFPVTRAPGAPIDPTAAQFFKRQAR